MNSYDIKKTTRDELHPPGKKKISLFDILSIFVRQRWIIINTTIIITLLIFLFVFITKIMPTDWPFNLMPDYYRPEVVINIQEPGSSILGKESGASAIASMLAGGGITTVNRYIELTEIILKGNTIKDRLIEEFDLLKELEPKTEKDYFFARRTIHETLDKKFHMSTSKNTGSTLFTISFGDGDSEFATQFLNRTLELVEARFRELTSGQVSRRKAFIEDRLQSTEAELKKAQDRMIQFQVTHGIIDISSQAREQTNLIADLSAELIKDELELETLLEYLPENSSKVVLLKNEIAKKKQLLKELKKGLPDSAIDVIPENQIPSLTTEYLNLKGEMDIQTRIYSTLREQYELVKIEENDNSQIFQIIEPAEELKLKSGPYRARMCFIGASAAFFFAIVLAFAREYFLSLKKNPVEAEKWETMKQMLKRKKK
jgi:uncharacterized protein involved in exopolysaccharide biosynthesis